MEQNFTQDDIVKTIQMIDEKINELESEKKKFDSYVFNKRSDIVERHLKNKDGYIVIHPLLAMGRITYSNFDSKKKAEEFIETLSTWYVYKSVIDDELNRLYEEKERHGEQYNTKKQSLFEVRNMFCAQLDDNHKKGITFYR